MAMKLPQDMLAQMRAATRNLMGGAAGSGMSNNAANATETIQRALAAAGLAPGAAAPQASDTPQARTMHDINPPPAGASAKAAPSAQEAAQAHQTTAHTMAQDFMARLGQHNFDMPSFEMPNFQPPGFGAPATTQAPLPAGAQFIAGSYRNHAGTRDYKLYIPSSYHGQAMPLVVMLHGCTQNPDDFAAGTQMNALAEEKQCFVAYPAQTQGANSSRCWNWFNAIDQQRGQGEPSLIAGITNEVIAQYGVDRKRVSVAGLSAGGAMAVIMGSTYPELYQAVGVHSGLPYASASDLSSALSAMRGTARRNHTGKTAAGAALAAIPIIVFHGDRDTTVSPA